MPTDTTFRRQLKPSITPTLPAGNSSTPQRPLRKKPFRNHASRACQRCRVKRIRCDANELGSGCSACRQEQVQCVLEYESDLRTRKNRDRVHLDQVSKLLSKLSQTLHDDTKSSSLHKLIEDLPNSTRFKAHLNQLQQKPPQTKSEDGSLLSTHNEVADDRVSPQSQGVYQDSVALSPTKENGVNASNLATYNDQNVGKASFASFEEEQDLDKDQRELLSKATTFSPSSSSRETYISPKQGAARHFGNLPISSAIKANGFPPHIQRRQLDLVTGPFEVCSPIHLNADSGGVADTVASAILTFKQVARSQIANGVPARFVLSMDGVDIDLFYRDRTPSDPHTVSTWACEFAKSWSSMGRSVQLLSIHYTTSLLRWLIMPCRETYLMMSPMMRPTPAQLMIPHTADIDLCHLSIVREHQLVHGGRWFDKVTAQTQRLLWPHDEEACVESVFVERPKPLASSSLASIDTSPKEPTLVKIKRLRPTFTQFCDQEDNWSIHRSMLQVVPGLEEHFKIHDDEFVEE